MTAKPESHSFSSHKVGRSVVSSLSVICMEEQRKRLLSIAKNFFRNFGLLSCSSSNTG